MKSLDIILKHGDITLPPKVYIVKGMVLPGVVYGCDCWTIKKAEHQRIDAEAEAPILWPLDAKN